MAFERIGASGESLRFRNNDWLVYRSNNGRFDVKVLRVNHSDIIEFMFPPYVGDQKVLIQSDLSALISRIDALERAVGIVESAQMNIFSAVITQDIFDSQQIVLPHAPINDKIIMLIRENLPQFAVSDFEVNGNIISWAGYDLPQLLQINDDVKFIYLHN